MNNSQRHSLHEAYILDDMKKVASMVHYFPKSLIKFYNGSYVNENNFYLDALKKQELWLSSPYYFNDPFDCVINVNFEEIAREVFLKKVHSFFNEEAAENFLNMVDEKTESLSLKMGSKKYKENVGKITDRIFVACFSEPCNLKSLRMWGHYANSHKGFCLEYDIIDICKCWEDGVLPVLYSNKYYIQQRGKTGQDIRRFKTTFAFTKAYEWNYEKEWRLLAIEEKAAGKAGFLSPFVTPIRAYLGCRIEEKLKDELIVICKQLGINVYELYMETNSYNLAYRQIDL